jgi:transcription elongation factor GreA
MKEVIKLPDPISFTKEGYEDVKKKIEDFKIKRKTAVINLRTARDMGDLSENAAYKAARFELSYIDRTIRYLRFQLRFGVVESETGGSTVRFGSRVTLESEGKQLSFMLVGSFESNPAKQKLSIKSPIGHAVLNKKVGEKIVVHTPSGDTSYTITGIQ